VDGKIPKKQNIDLLLRLTPRRHKCPGGTVFYPKRIQKSVRYKRRLESMGAGKLSNGKKVSLI
jgi:hypothetical protein